MSKLRSLTKAAIAVESANGPADYFPSANRATFENTVADGLVFSFLDVGLNCGSGRRGHCLPQRCYLY